MVGEIETETLAGVTETVALADTELCAALWAVTVTLTEGIDAGAVYIPVDVIVPAVEFPPRLPSTIQLTAVLLVPETEALNCWECPTCTLAVVGEIETDTADGALTRTEALAIAEVNITLCAVTVTALEGAAAGAVYNPVDEIVPVAGLPPTVPFTSQFTLTLLVPDTEAVNCNDCPVCKLADVGEMETLTLFP